MTGWDEATLPPARRAPAVHYGGPEDLFGITGLSVHGAVASATVELAGRYASDAGLGGGALAVLVDDALGYAVVTACPVERWSVSTDITLDLVAPLRPGTRVSARARALYADEDLSLGECEVRDDEGRLLAIATQRGRFTATLPDDTDGDEAIAVAVRDAIDRGTAGGIAALIGARCEGPDERTSTSPLPAIELTVRAELGNRFGALHGGVALAASLLAAEAELVRLGASGLAPTSIRITYPRPIPAAARVRFTAEARHTGRSFAVLEVTGEVDGRLCTSAQVTAHPFAQ